MSEIRESFEKLQTEMILEAAESCGQRATGRLLQLNSMENRVYAVEVEHEDPDRKPKQVIVKFYRPNRWTADEILSEHAMQALLAQENIPTPRFLSIQEKKFRVAGCVPFSERVVPEARAALADVSSLGTSGDMYFCVWEKIRGRAPLELDVKNLQEIGSFLGRMHNMFENSLRPQAFTRPVLSTEQTGVKALAALEAWGKIPRPLDVALLGIIEGLVKGLEWVDDCIEFIPVHGDLHRLNLMQTEERGNFWFVDFDDCMWAPDIQDLWLLASGCHSLPHPEKDPALVALECLIEGYEEFRELPEGEEELVEPLRTLRMTHYLGWIASRWHDPLFRETFSFFTEFSYWERTLAEFEKQRDALLEKGLLAH